MATKIGGITIDLAAEIAKFRSDMNAAAGSVRSFASDISGSLHSLEEFNKKVVEFLAVREVVNFLREAAQASQEWAGELAKFQNLAGVSSTQAAALAAATRLAGVSTETVTGAMAKLGVVLEKTPQKFAELGIKTRDASQHFLPLPQILANTVQGLDKFKAGTDRTAAAGLLFGKTSEVWVTEISKLGPLLKSASFAEITSLVVGLGLASENAKAKEEEWARTTGLLKLEFLGFQNQIGTALLPALKSVAEAIGTYAKNGDLKRWAEETAQGIAVLTIGLVTLADFVAQHNDLIGVALAAGGTAAIQSGTVKGVAAGVAAIGAAWAITGSKADKAAAAAHQDLQKILVDLKAAQSQIGKPIQGGSGAGEAAGGSKTFVDVDQIAKAQKKFEQLRSELVLSAAAEKAALAVADQDAGTRRAEADAAQVQLAVQKFQNETIQLGTVATKAQTDAIAKYKTEELATKNVVQDVTKATEALRAMRLDTEGVQAQIQVARLNHGLTTQEIEDRRQLQNQLDAKLSIDKEQLPLTQAQADARARAVIDLGQTRDLLQDVNAANQVFAQTRDPFENYSASLDKLNQQFRDGLIDEQTYTRAVDQAQATYTGVATQTDVLRDAAKQAGSALGDAFKSAIQPGNDLIGTAKNLLKALEDIAVEALVIKPFERSLNGEINGSSSPSGAGGGTSGGGGFLSSIMGLFGGGGGSGAGLFSQGSSAAAGQFSNPSGVTFANDGGFLSSIGSLFSGFFDDGGSFVVGGRGGKDTNLVQFRATRGERVTIDPVGGKAPRMDTGAASSREASAPIITMNVMTNDAHSFRASRDQIIGDMHRSTRKMGRYA